MTNQGLLSILKSNIKDQKIVQAHEQLKSEVWTKSCYELLSKLISQKLGSQLSQAELYELGASISYKTLKNIYSDMYCISSPIDPRTMNTLNKLSKFTNYQDWNSFVSQNRTIESQLEHEDQPTDKITALIKSALAEAFKAIYHLSIKEKVHLKEYYMENSAAFNRIAEIIYHNKHSGLCINNKYNPSNNQLMDLKIEYINGNAASVHTKEYWLLCWWDSKLLNYHNRVKKIYNNNYILKRNMEGQWIITNIISKDDLFETF